MWSRNASGWWYRMIWCFAVVVAQAVVIICLFDVYVEGFIFSTPLSQKHPHKGIEYTQRVSKRRSSSLYSAPEGLCWFVKTEQFCKPFPEVKPHLEAHREWVRSIREQEDNNQQQQHSIVSGYRVDEFDRPGGGGLMIFAAKDYEAAEKFIMKDPLVANECVDWRLNKWIAETGDISIE